MGIGGGLENRRGLKVFRKIFEKTFRRVEFLIKQVLINFVDVSGAVRLLPRSGQLLVFYVSM